MPEGVLNLYELSEFIPFVRSSPSFFTVVDTYKIVHCRRIYEIVWMLLWLLENWKIYLKVSPFPYLIFLSLLIYITFGLRRGFCDLEVKIIVRYLTEYFIQRVFSLKRV